MRVRQIPDDVLRRYLRERDLLGADSNAKTAKGRAKGFATFIMYMAPAMASGFQACAMATKGCVKGCLNTSGRGAFSATQYARRWKAQAFFRLRDEFMAKLDREIIRSCRWARERGLTPVFRLNGTTDIRWETVRDSDGLNVFERHPEVQFYDYTKLPNRWDLPDNYHLTFSYSGANGIHAYDALEQGMNVAVVFRSREIVDSLSHVTINGRRVPVVDGDADDLRFLDERGVVALYAKGKAKRDDTGFVLDSNRIPMGSLPVLRSSLACAS